MANPIDTSTMPGDDVSPEAITAAAASIRYTGERVADQTAAVVSSWQRLARDYEAPESGTLLHAMHPAKTEGETFKRHLAATATALETFAEEARAIRRTVADIRTRANAFTESIRGGVSQTVTGPKGDTTEITVAWDEDQASVDHNNALRGEVYAQQVALQQAERRCANAIYDLTGHVHISAASDTNPNGYGTDLIPDPANSPWGEKVDRQESCSETVALALKHAVVDGLIVGAGGNALRSSPAIFGWTTPTWDRGTWSWDPSTARDALVGTGMLAAAIGNPANGLLALIPGGFGDPFRANQQAVTGFLKGTFAWDTWADHPAEAFGETVGNLLLLRFGIGAGAGAKAAAAGVRAGEEVSAASKAATAARTATQALDPLVLTVQAAKYASRGARWSVEQLSNLLKDLDFSKAVDVHHPKLDLPNLAHDATVLDRPAAHSHDAPAPRRAMHHPAAEHAHHASDRPTSTTTLDRPLGKPGLEPAHQEYADAHPEHVDGGGTETPGQEPHHGTRSENDAADLPLPDSHEPRGRAARTEGSLQSGAKPGEEPTPETIRQGTVRMEVHPHYEHDLARLRAHGFKIVETIYDPAVVKRRVVDVTGRTLRYELEVQVQPGMRYLDLEHEMGHFDQISDKRRFPEGYPVTQIREDQLDGSPLTRKNLADPMLLSDWQNSVAEYHVRLEEVLRLDQRGVPPEVLQEHLDGLDLWRDNYKKAIKDIRFKPASRTWLESRFFDVSKLEQLVKQVRAVAG